MGRWKLVAVLVVLGGCVFRTADAPRFFRPSSAMLDPSIGEAADPPVADGVAIRLREVRSEPYLRERIVWRVSAVEYGLYEQRRWLDLPAHYVDRALAARLRETPGLRLTNALDAAALRVDVLAFDDVLAPKHEADVSLAVALEDHARGPVFRRTFDARAGVEDDDPASLAKAMGRALDDAVAEVAEAVGQSLHAQRASVRR
jgi:ABC-type uncharacterized transport system auxiliary subunit